MIVQKPYALKLASADAAGDRGQFRGVALVYGERDAMGDVIREGCFKKSIHDSQGRFPCLWSHDPQHVLGNITVEEDGRSLTVSGSLLTDAIPKAREVYALIKARAVRGLSVAFLPIRAAPTDSGSEFVEGRLVEISLTAIPAYQSAQVTEVRALDQLVRSLDRNADRDALVMLRRQIDEILETTDPPGPARELVEVLAGFDVARWRRR